jgi:hypothetical protein
MESIETAGPKRGAARTRATGVIALLVALAVSLTACGSSNNAATTTTLNRAAAPGLIQTAYQTLFNFSDKTVSTKVAVIQDGSAVQSALSDALNSSLSSSATGAKIDTTTLQTSAQCTSAKLSSPCAKLSYDILGAGGTPLLAGQTGYAVYVSGQWLVAKVTICTLLGLFYSAEGKSGSPPGC